MTDKRTVDEISIEELEQLITTKKRDARIKQMQRMQKTGRIINSEPTGLLEKMIESQKSNSNSDENRKIKNSARDTIFQGKTKPLLWSKITDASLIIVEIVIVIGLIYVGIEMFSSIGNLQQKTAETQRIAESKQRELVPTLEPTPQLKLTNVVLPTGHTPPNQVGGGQFNFNEIPAQMRSLIANQIFLPPDIERPLPTDETPLVLRIPKLNIDHTIVQGVDWEALKLGIGQVPNGTTPSDLNGNVVLAAHNDIYGELFRYLDQLEPGDKFQIQTKSRLYNYTITKWDIYEPTAVEVMDPRGQPTSTLISCYPYQVNDKRIVVFADLDTSA